MADEFAAALTEFPEIQVIPVTRTLAALHVLGVAELESAQDAQTLMQHMGADAVLVAAVTEFSPYDPPRIGIVLQWYDAPARETAAALDPVAASRAKTTLAPLAESPRPMVQLQRTYDAGDQRVLREMRDFARARDGRESPYGWRVHAKSVALFIRYISCTAVQTILQQAVEFGAPESTREAS